MPSRLEDDVDDLIWNHMHSSVFQELCVSWVESCMLKRRWPRAECIEYAMRKGEEHLRMKKKLLQIRFVIHDPSMRSSLDPLINHHSSLVTAYHSLVVVLDRSRFWIAGVSL